MTLITKTYTFSSGAVITAAEHNTNFDTVFNDYNGNIINANIKSTAAIADSKLAQLTTASKVNLSAVVATSQATGDVIYASSATALARLGKGTANQILSMNAGATLPEWVDGSDKLDVITVGANGDYTTIQGAIDVAAAGDTILVAEGTYAEVVTYDLDNLTIAATGSAENTIISQATAAAVVFGTSSGCTLRGFTVTVTAANGNADYCISSANDATTDYNIIENCIVSWASATALTAAAAISITDGNTIVRNCRITGTNTQASTDGSHLEAIVQAGAHTFICENNLITITNATTNTTHDSRGISVAGTAYITGNEIVVSTDGKTTYITLGIAAGVATAYIVGNPRISATSTSTALARAVQASSGGIVVVGNFIHAATSDSDGIWLECPGTTTTNASGNTITGDGAVGSGGTLNLGPNNINGVTSFGTINAAPTVGNAIFVDGFTIGADSTDNQLDDATHGSAGTTMYIGDESITTTDPSDEACKKEIVNTKFSLSDLNKMVVQDFKFKTRKDKRKQTGMMADKVEKIVPTAVFERSDGLKSIDYPKLIPLLIKSIQELSKEVKKLKNA